MEFALVITGSCASFDVQQSVQKNSTHCSSGTAALSCRSKMIQID